MTYKYRKGNNAAAVRDRDLRLVNQGTWIDRAACAGVDITLFYEPDKEIEAHKAARVNAAKDICNACPVQRECLETAIGNDEAYGVWGGLTANELYLLARRGSIA